MAETPDQMADRWANEVMAHATAHVEHAMTTDPDTRIDLDHGARRELLELGITAGYTAALELLIREGLLPTTGSTT